MVNEITKIKTNSSVVIKEVLSKSDLRLFVDFPNKLYKNNKNFVPAFYSDDLDDWNKNKNPAFEYCEARCFLAYKNGELVGRIGAILSHKANDKWNTSRMRFSQVDFIDDHDVSKALFDTVEKWAKEKGCTQVHGPLGFTDMDREGMLVEGFDKRNMFITYYNEPYYNDHLNELGYQKDTDWIEYKVFVPDTNSDIAELLKKVANRCEVRNNLHIVKVKHQWQFSKYVNSVFELANICYAPLYGTVDLTDKQIKRYSKKFIPLLNPKYACFVADENDKLVAFGVSAPSMAEAVKKSNGRMLPLGFIRMLRALNKNDAVDMFLIAVRPDLQKTGANAMLLYELLKSCNKNGIKYAETGPMLETNAKVLSQWKAFEKEQHKRRRCYIKNID